MIPKVNFRQRINPFNGKAFSGGNTKIITAIIDETEQIKTAKGFFGKTDSIC